MPLTIGNVQFPSEEYTLYYAKKDVSIAVSAPTKADAEDIFTWLAKATGMIP